MDKILIKLEVPSIRQKYEMFISSDIMVEEFVSMVTRSLTSITYEKYVISGEEILSSKENNILLSRNQKISEFHIKNGDTLLLT